MKAKNLGVAAGIAIGVAVAGFIIWDYLPEVDSDPSNAPVEIISMVSASAVPFTPVVANPAGIAFMPDSGTYLVSTDDRVIAEVQADFSTVLSSITLANNPHSIGDTEGVTYLGNGKAAAVGENGVIVLLERNGAVWEETERFPITGFKNGTQLGSAAYDPATDTIYSAQKKGDKILYKIDLNSRTAAAAPMRLGSAIKERSDRSWQEFTIAGMHFHNGRLYAISEAFSSLLVVSADGIVEDVIGLRGINESSGITLRNGVLTLIGDAESYMPDPPIYFIDKSVTDR